MASLKDIRFRVNGQNVVIQTIPGEMLSTLLRERLGLTGTKVGCNEAECGACSVLVDNTPILSCTYPAVRVHGKSVLTIEGLAKFLGDTENLNPLQKTFMEQGAVQCGFCIPGQIMIAYGLLKEKTNPSREDIHHAFKDTLCRCGGYSAIERSIQVSAKEIFNGNTSEKPTIETSKRKKRIIGSVQIRPEALEKVTGKAIYTDDLKFEGMLFGMAKRSGIPHGILRSINIEKASGLPGVVAVMTARDIPGEHTHGIVINDWPILVDIGERIRYVGDAIALVAAKSREIAIEAVKLIETDVDELTPIIDPKESLQTNSERLHEKGNLLKHIKVRKGDIEKGFQDSNIILEHTFQTQMTDHAFLEPECSVARINSDNRLEIYVGSQIPYADRNQVARALNWPEERIRIIGTLIGGGFGGKEDITGQIHAALLAEKTRRPVKVLYDRHESFLVHPKRHATEIKIKMGSTKEGFLQVVQTELFGDTGAYASLGEKVMTRATTHSSGPYEIPHVKADCYAVYTNNPPAGAFRGFGVLQSIYAIESMMDMMAKRLNIDPVIFRQMNALKLGSITNTGQILKESVGLTECIHLVDREMRKIAGNDPFSPKPIIGAAHLISAWGFAAAYKNTGLGGGAPDKSSVEIELFDSGAVEVRTSSAEIGQGLVTVLQMIVAEELALPIEKVNVLLSDTDLTPDGGPTTASRQTFVTGNAAKGAAQALKQAMISTIAERYDCSPDKICFHEGLAQFDFVTIPFGQIASEMRKEGKPLRALYEYWAPVTKPLGEGGEMHFAYSFSVQAAEVVVNTKTGEVNVRKVISATDVGTAINPLGLQGQIEGGIVMGIGNAITEDFVVDKGKVITDRLAKYHIPSISHTPEITSFIVEHPVESGPYGAKGIGEVVCIPTSPAITNAIYNAVGVRIDHLPVDQELIAREYVNNNRGKL